MPTAVCTPVLRTLIMTVQLSFLSERLEHRIHPGDTTRTPDNTQSQMLSSGSPTKNKLMVYIYSLKMMNIVEV